jgi:hypothetical protein
MMERPHRNPPALAEFDSLRASRLERIAQRAHELYEARGCHDGRDQDDWFQAEKEIDREDAEHAYQLSA